MNNIVYILGAAAVGVGGLLAYQKYKKPTVKIVPTASGPKVAIEKKGYWKGAGRGKVWVPAKTEIVAEAEGGYDDMFGLGGSPIRYV